MARPNVKVSKSQLQEALEKAESAADTERIQAITILLRQMEILADKEIEDRQLEFQKAMDLIKMENQNLDADVLADIFEGDVMDDVKNITHHRSKQSELAEIIAKIKLQDFLSKC
jgi:hypothetical protein